MSGSQLLNHTVPGQVSRRQLTSVKCPFFWPETDNLLFLNKRKRGKSTDVRFYIWTVCIQSGCICYQPSYRAWCLDSTVWMGGGDRGYPYKFRYRVEE